MPKRGEWVIIHSHTLSKEERAPQVPDDTKNVPLEMWIKGKLLADAKLGEMVSIKTITGRVETGELLEVNPVHRHSFGEFIPEVLEIDRRLQAALYGGEVDG